MSLRQNVGAASADIVRSSKIGVRSGSTDFPSGLGKPRFEAPLSAGAV